MVEFRVSGVELTPASITQALGLEASLVRELDERKGEGRVWKEALWSYNGFPADTPKTWPSIEDGLIFLLDRLEPLRSQIESLKQKWEVLFWCGHFQSSFDGGPVLSASLLRRLADFGLDLYIDNYFEESATEEAKS